MAVELPRVAHQLLAIVELHAHLAGTGRPRLVEVLRLLVRGIAVEAPHEEDRLELCDRDFEAVGLRIV